MRLHTLRDKSWLKIELNRAFLEMAASPSDLTGAAISSHIHLTGRRKAQKLKGLMRSAPSKDDVSVIWRWVPQLRDLRLNEVENRTERLEMLSFKARHDLLRKMHLVAGEFYRRCHLGHIWGKVVL